MRKPKPLFFLMLIILLSFVFIYTVNQHPQTSSSIKKEPLPEALNPKVDKKKDQLVKLAAEKGISVVITDGFRSAEEQDKLYKQGRTDSGRIVTNLRGGDSYHNFGLAFDYALKDKSGNIIWDIEYDGNNNGKADWMEVARIGKSLGFEWGGDWKNFKDYPHLQMTFGLTIHDLKNGERPESV
ncbi:M15 family metallopeptidase [Peribacillus kribbensis]|uniref:M15 family metallopeptidase n=1 Tax=Peribacillus kribbensis TaxID=356658 RepID=UPI000402E20D|nr:M15 family metallopeptidase [Peribacillus kribbensis]